MSSGFVWLFWLKLGHWFWCTRLNEGRDRLQMSWLFLVGSRCKVLMSKASSLVFFQVRSRSRSHWVKFFQGRHPADCLQPNC